MLRQAVGTTGNQLEPHTDEGDHTTHVEASRDDALLTEACSCAPEDDLWTAAAPECTQSPDEHVDADLADAFVTSLFDAECDVFVTGNTQEDMAEDHSVEAGLDDGIFVVENTPEDAATAEDENVEAMAHTLSNLQISSSKQSASRKVLNVIRTTWCTWQSMPSFHRLSCAKEATPKGDALEAARCYSQLIARDPIARLFTWRSASWQAAGKYQQALCDTEHAISLEPSRTRAHYQKAVACMALKRDKDAESAIVNGLKTEPTFKKLLELGAKLRKSRTKAAPPEDQISSLCKRVYHSDTTVKSIQLLCSASVFDHRLIKRSRVAARLKKCHTLADFKCVGTDVVELAGNEQTTWMWQFAVGFALAFEKEDPPLCMKILEIAFTKVDRSHLGYLYVLPRYFNVCVPDDKRHEYFELLYEAHDMYNKWQPSYGNLDHLDLLVEILLVTSSDTLTLKYLATLHKANGCVEDAVAWAECALQNIAAEEEQYAAMKAKGIIMGGDFIDAVGCQKQQVLLLLGDWYAHLGLFVDAAEVVDQLVTVEETLEPNNNYITTRLRKAEFLLKGGFPEDAVNSLMKNFPLWSLVPGHDPCPGQIEYRAMWTKLMDHCIDSIISSSANKCAFCGASATRRCTGCFSVFYCNQAHLKAHRKEHRSACKLTPEGKFNKLFHSVMSALYKYGSRWHSTLSWDAREHRREYELRYMAENGLASDMFATVTLFGGVSILLLQKQTIWPRMIYWADKLLSAGYTDLAESFLHLYDRTMEPTLLTTYIAAIRSDWRDTVCGCVAYRTRYQLARSQTDCPTERSIMCDFLESVALFNLGYVGYAQIGIADFEKHCPVPEIKVHAQELMILVYDGDVVWPMKNDKICFYCGMCFERLRKCEACNLAVYCSKLCQESDWKFHKRLCKAERLKHPESGIFMDPKSHRCKKLMKRTGKNKSNASSSNIQFEFL